MNTSLFFKIDILMIRENKRNREAIDCEIKYFNETSLEDLLNGELIIGKKEITLISINNHIKNQEEVVILIIVLDNNKIKKIKYIFVFNYL